MGSDDPTGTRPQAAPRRVQAEQVQFSGGQIRHAEARSIEVSQGGIALAVSDRVTVKEGGIAVAVADSVTMDSGSVTVAFARQIRGDVRVLIDLRAVVLLGAIAAVILRQRKCSASSERRWRRLGRL
jgi:hypothetical protein